MENQVLSREQMNTLIEKGLDITNASMIWVWNSKKEDWVLKVIKPGKEYDRYLPTFTVYDLLKVLPTSIMWWEEVAPLHIDLYEGRMYYKVTRNDDETILGEQSFSSSDFTTALYKLLLWSLEN